jgi:hypothetical protein
MNDREIIHHLMDIKERLSSLETKVDGVLEGGAERDADISRLKTKMTKAESSVKTLRWVGTLIFIAVPATAAAIAKILKP